MDYSKTKIVKIILLLLGLGACMEKDNDKILRSSTAKVQGEQPDVASTTLEFSTRTSATIDKSSLPGPGAFLKVSSDLAMPATAELRPLEGGTDLADAVNYLEFSAINYFDSSASPASSAEGSCANPPSLIVEVSGDTLTVKGELNLQACLRNAFVSQTQPTQKIVKASYKFYLWKRCIGADLSAFHNKQVNPLQPLNFSCAGALEIDQLQQSQFDYDLSYAQVAINSWNERPIVDVALTITSALAAGELPCRRILNGDKYSYLPGCKALGLSKFNKLKLDGKTQAHDLKDYFAISYDRTNLASDDNGKWPSSGSADIIVRNKIAIITFDGKGLASSYASLLGPSVEAVKIEDSSGEGASSPQAGHKLLAFFQNFSRSLRAQSKDEEVPTLPFMPSPSGAGR